MTAITNAATLGVFLLGFSSTAFAQGPPPPPPPPPPMSVGAPGPQKTGTAKLSGRVTSLDTGRPIRRAVVTAMGSELREGKSVSTDAEGRWELRDLPAGRFSLSASKGGFVSISYGQRRPFEPGKAIDLKDKQTIDKLDFTLPRASAMTGRVVDEFGDPVTGVRVSAMRYRFNSGQRRMTSTGRDDVTDDLGQFRIYGLAPGDYFVVAQPPNVGAFMSASADRTGYAQTYFPDSHTAGGASKVALTVGQEAQNLVIALAPTRVATISGTIVKADGKPITAGMVRLLDPAVTSMMPTMGLVRPDGSFTISGVVPGEYRLTAQILERSFEEIGTTGSGVGAMQHAQMPMTVTGDDVTGVLLTASPGGTIAGVVRFEGTAPSAATGSAILGLDASNTGIGIAAAGTIKPDWSFQLAGLFGRRMLRPTGLPAGWTLKSVIFNGQDVTDAGIDVPPGAELTGVEVHVTQKAAELSGTVQTAKGTPTSDYVVLLFSPDADKWGWQSRFVRASRPDQTGRFVIDGLPAASYLAVALEYLEPGEEGNPELLQALIRLATKVSLDEGEKKTVTLKLSAQ